ncbi:MAG: HD domain-containing protein [Bacteroidota bacterium]
MSLPPKTLSHFSRLFERIHSLVANIDTQLPPFYLVGGAVRDCLLERSCRDVDLVSPSAESLANLLADVNGARAVRFEKRKGELNFRVVSRTASEEILDISQMQEADITEDLNLRDFTINAIAVPYRYDSVVEVIDPLDGRADLSRKVIRQTSENSLRHDSVRILRAFRLAAELGFQLDSATCVSIESLKNQLADAAPERIREELVRIFNVSESKSIIQKMDDLGVLSEVFPEIDDLKGCIQNTYHDLDVWGHSLMVLDSCEYITNHLTDFFGDTASEIYRILTENKRLPLLKFAALFHDIGKPAAQEMRGADKRITFYGHEKKGARQIGQAARSLRFSSKECDYLEFLVAEHLHVLALFKPDVKRSTLAGFIRKAKDDFIPLLILGMSDVLGKTTCQTNTAKQDEYIGLASKAAKQFFNQIKPQLDRKALVTGKDLLSLGLKPGPVIGEILNALQKAQDEGLVTNRDSALTFAEKLIHQKGTK